MDSSTVSISEQDFDRLVRWMANDSKFMDKLADGIAQRLDEKFGHQQGFMSEKMEELSEKIDRMDQRMTAGFRSVDERFDTLDHNFKTLGEKLQLHDGEFRKVNDRLDKIDGHLGINTDTRKRA